MFLVLGVCCCLFSVYATVDQVAFLAKAATAEGTVVDFAQHRTGTAGSTISPIVTFYTKDNELVQFESEFGSGILIWSRGETVQVKYLVDKTSVAEIDSFVTLWASSLSLIFWRIDPLYEANQEIELE
jgi:hypothetical protein